MRVKFQATTQIKMEQSLIFPAINQDGWGTARPCLNRRPAVSQKQVINRLWLSKGQPINNLSQRGRLVGPLAGIKKEDFEKLEYNAIVTHKLPVFVVNFLSDNSVYLLVKPEDILDVANNLIVDKPIEKDYHIDIDLSNKKKKKIKSSCDSREEYEKERQEKYKKDKSAT